ncbi:MAG: efflux RND transporter permease subunit, partial [Planctomycetota bacterium]
MTRSIIAWCVKNRFLVVVLTLMVAAAGVWGMLSIPLDAIPDLSDVQVIVYSQWMGRDPETIEDQVTYPLTTKMLAVPDAKVVRGYSFFGFSLVYVIFEDGTDIYWARSRVLEYLSDIQGRLPEGVTTSLGPDATGVGWVYEYTLESGRYCPNHPEGLYRPAGKDGPYYEEPPEGLDVEIVRLFEDMDHCPVDGTPLVEQLDLGELRALQDWYLRYQLTAVEGVAEVASVGGFERQFQVTVDPNRLLAYGIPLKKVIGAIRSSNNDVGGRLLEISETEYMVRGRGYLKAVDDLEKVAIGVSPQGTPVLLKDVAQVAIGPDIRRGIAEKDGRGEVVAGIIVMRYGENALEVIDRVKGKLAELQKGLPPGVEIRTAYDRSALILRSIDTLKTQLLEEMLIVALVCILFLWHARSALVAAVTLPLGILMSFIVMYLIGVNANIMSLGGIAVAIGAMVDAAVVLVENAHKRLHEQPDRDRWEVIVEASQEVGPALFFSLLIITVSFLPVFALQEQAGRLFKPLAYTKTFAMAASSILAITIIPVAIAFFVSRSTFPERWARGRKWAVSLLITILPLALANKLAMDLEWAWFREHRVLLAVGWIVLAVVVFLPQRIRGEEGNPVTRFLIWIYMPVIRWVLR